MNIEIAVLFIIIANVIISMIGFNNADFFDKYKFYLGKITQQNQYIRMFSSGFLHADYLHLILNMYVLYSFAPIVCYFIGEQWFILIYIVSLLAGSLLTLFYYFEDRYYTAVGASGAVAGIIFSSILLYPEMEIGILFIPIGIPGYIFGVLYILYSIYGMKGEMSNIGHTAHIGGAIGGFVCTLLIKPEIFEQNLSTVILVAAPIILLFVLERFK